MGEASIHRSDRVIPSDAEIWSRVVRWFQVGSTTGRVGDTTPEPLGKIMRRRLGIFIPIVLLSILVQIIAPISAFRVVAYAASDPLYMSPICAGMASPGSSQSAPADTHQGGAACCAFCAAGHGGAVALDPPPPVFVTLQREYRLVSWLEAADPVPVVRIGSNAQARGPPLLA
jgi:hypothetical protein